MFLLEVGEHTSENNDYDENLLVEESYIVVDVIPYKQYCLLSTKFVKKRGTR